MKFLVAFIIALFLPLGASSKVAIRSNVLQHFRNDSLKYQAALYLLDNMDAHFSYTSKDIATYYNIMDSLFHLPRQKDDVYKHTYLEASTRNGSLLDNAKTVWDNDAISDKQLISFIEEAFSIWQKPWNKDVSFEMFRDYVLPYRITTEPVSNWRELYYNKYHKKVQSLYNSQINHTYKYGLYGELNKGFYGALYYPESYIPELPLDILLNMQLGNCESNAKRNIAQLRAMGIPAALDFVPQWGNRSMGHSWAVMFTGDENHFIPFGLNEPLGIHFYFRPDHKLPKVYRHTFGKQQEMEAFAADKESIVPEYLHGKCIKDVTELYTEVSDVEINIADKDVRWVYLCVFDDKDWIPVSFAKNRQGKVSFKKLGRGVVYLPASINSNGELVVEGAPFSINLSGKVDRLIPNVSKNRSISVKRKYTFTSNLKEFCENTIGGKFQVANKEDFSDSVTIATISKTDESGYNSISVTGKSKWKYFRYLSPDDSYGNMAEIEVYSKNKTKLIPQRMFGTRGAIKNHNLEKALDGDPLTSYSLPFPNGGIVAMEFEEPLQISEIRYLPRNDGNYIEDGDHYALYYWDSKDWRLVSEQDGNRDGVLTFDNVPYNALLLLRDLTKGSQERIFTYEDGKQIWW